MTKHNWRLGTYLLLTLIFIVTGCRNARTNLSPPPKLTLPEPTLPSESKPITVKLGEFLCDDSITGQATKNVFSEVLSRNRNVKLVRDGESDLLIEGTITHSQGGSSGSRIGAVSKSQTVVGDYISGVTAVAYYHGQLLTSASWGQTLEKGSKLLPPEYVAKEAALSLQERLERNFLAAFYSDIVWCGLDYSKVEIFDSKESFQKASAFPAMTQVWNTMFVERTLSRLERSARSLKLDLKSVQDSNKKTSDSQFRTTENPSHELVLNSHIAKLEIAELVRSYSLESKAGTGWVFIMDRLVRAEDVSCFYVVFFDVASREIIYCERFYEKSSGRNLEDYWFTPIESAVKKLTARRRRH